MANLEHQEILRKGVAEWNQWRKEQSIRPDLRRADFRDQKLVGIDLSGAILVEADFCHTDLTDANLQGANLLTADFYSAKLIRANLQHAELLTAMFVETDLTDAKLEGSVLYGASVWKVKLSAKTNQRNLVVTPPDEPTITVDDLQMAQFV
jgi:uncharacterized protein YjbI with pentapeptide repeats